MPTASDPAVYALGLPRAEIEAILADSSNLETIALMIHCESERRFTVFGSSSKSRWNELRESERKAWLRAVRAGIADLLWIPFLIALPLF